MYQAELVPAAMRGTVVGSLQLFNQIGQVMAAGVNRAFSKSMERSGSVCMQQIIAKLIEFAGGSSQSQYRSVAHLW